MILKGIGNRFFFGGGGWGGGGGFVIEIFIFPSKGEGTKTFPNL